ncbi:hypothetical protein ID866_7303 [Astraeus odoratus]|nr:hypothetical protein ID866_7303 [Astraeus odoratus]
MVAVQSIENGYFCAYIVTSSSNAFKLIVDTASSYTWVGARSSNPYLEGLNSRATGVPAKNDYAGGLVTFQGQTYNDTIALGDLIIDNQGIGVPTEVRGFPAGPDGILGLGPTGLTTGISADGNLIPTVIDNLYSEGTISSPFLGVYFVPNNVGGSGLLSFGQVDESVLTSDVNYVPVTTISPASSYWGVDTTIMYGVNVPILRFGSGILDTGSNRITLASASFYAYASATGGFVHPSGQIGLTQNQYNNLQTLHFFIGGQYYHLSPNAQIYPRSSPNNLITLVVQPATPDFPLAFILGIPFMYVFTRDFPTPI